MDSKGPSSPISGRRVSSTDLETIVNQHRTGTPLAIGANTFIQCHYQRFGGVPFGAEAGEVMAVVQTAMLANLPYPRLRDAILAHPTMAEGLGDLFAKVPPRSGL
jgi:hypothetical protein